jgi:hypothetical protein
LAPLAAKIRFTKPNLSKHTQPGTLTPYSGAIAELNASLSPLVLKSNLKVKRRRVVTHSQQEVCEEAGRLNLFDRTGTYIRYGFGFF